MKETFTFRYKEEGRILDEVIEKVIYLDDMQPDEEVLQEIGVFIDVLRKVYELSDEQFFYTVIAALELRGNNPIENEFNGLTSTSDKEEHEDCKSETTIGFKTDKEED